MDLLGYYFDAEKNRYFKITNDNRHGITPKIDKVPNILMNSNICDYLQKRQYQRTNRIQCVMDNKVNIEYDIDDLIDFEDFLVFASGYRICVFKDQKIIKIHENSSKITKLVKHGDNTFIYSLLGGSIPGSVFICSIDPHTLDFHCTNSIVLPNGSVYSFGINNSFLAISSEKRIFIYSLTSFNLRMKLRSKSDVLHMCAYRKGIVLSCRNGDLLFLNLYQFYMTLFHSCSSLSTVQAKNDILYACSATILVTFNHFEVLSTLECMLKRMVVIGDYLIQISQSSSIIMCLASLHIEYILPFECSQFYHISTGIIANNNLQLF